MIYPDTVGCKTCLDVGVLIEDVLIERLGMDPYPAGRTARPCPDCRIGERMAAAWSKPRAKQSELSLREAGREVSGTIDRWKADLLHGNTETPQRNKLRREPTPFEKANEMVKKQPAPLPAMAQVAKALEPKPDVEDERARRAAEAAAKLEADYTDEPDEPTYCYGEDGE